MTLHVIISLWPISVLVCLTTKSPSGVLKVTTLFWVFLVFRVMDAVVSTGPVSLSPMVGAFGSAAAPVTMPVIVSVPVALLLPQAATDSPAPARATTVKILLLLSCRPATLAPPDSCRAEQGQIVDGRALVGARD